MTGVSIMHFGRDVKATVHHLEVLLVLCTVHPTTVTATGRLRARTLNALTQRMSAWAARTGSTGLGDAAADDAHEALSSDAVDTSMPALITLAEHLHLIAATAGHLRPLPAAAVWLALSLDEQRRDIDAALLRREPGDHAGLGELGAFASLESPAVDDVAAPAARDLLLLEPALSLLDGPSTLPGARLALAAWAEWDEARSCLRLTEASVSRAAAPILVAGQDAASVLADLLRRVAEPAPTEAQLRRMHAWCVARAAGNASDQLPRQRDRRSQPNDAGTMAWRLAALRLVAALSPSVPGIGSPPAEAYEGLGATPDPALDSLVAGWVAAIMNAKGVGGLPVGVDPRLLETVEAALAMGEDLHLRYRSDKAVETWRPVAPQRLEWHRGRLLLVAHCQLRNAERHFRMDRVLDVRPSAGRLAAEGETS